MTKQEALAIAKSSNPLMRGASADPKYVGIIIECIEKQIPKKPHKHEDDYYVCPVCDVEVTPSKVANTTYCKYCGNKLDWSDNE